MSDRGGWRAAELWRGPDLQWLFLLLLGLHLVPIWTFTYFPSQDGPSHLSNAVAIRDYLASSNDINRQYYELAWGWTLNWGSYLLLVPLLHVLPPLIAEKILLSICVLLLPISLRYALRAIGPSAASWSLLIFPFVYSFTFNMGFYNFSLSLPLFFFAVGYWLRNQEEWSARHVAGLAAICALLSFVHPVTFAAAALTTGTLALYFSLAELVGRHGNMRATPDASWLRFRRRLAVLACGLLPAAAPWIFFLPRFGGDKEWYGAGQLWEMLQHCRVLVSYSEGEVWLSSAVALLFAGVAAIGLILKATRRSFQRQDGLLLVSLVLMGAFFLVPNKGFGGGLISIRLLLFPFFALILWFGAQAWPRPIARVAQLLAAAISLAFLGTHMSSYQNLNAYLLEYTSAAQAIEPGKTILPVNQSGHGSGPNRVPLSIAVEPFRHAAGYLAADRRGVLLRNYEARRRTFPLTYRPEVDPFVHIGRDGPIGSSSEFGRYSETSSGSLDYVVVWQDQFWRAGDRRLRRLTTQLQRGFELIFVSKPNGFMKVFRARTGPAQR